MPENSHTTKILLVDDHQVVCDALRCLLKDHDDLEVVGIALDGVKALKLAAEVRPDVIVLDIAMPGISGLETAERLRTEYPQVSLVMLSMLADPERVAQALSLGARGYVLKECAGTDLVRAIRSVRAGHYYLAASVTDNLIKDYLRLRELERTTPAPSLLSDREREVLVLQVEGRSTKEIAEKLCLSPKTVETYRYRIREKLDIHDSAGLVKYALKEGLIELE